MIFFLSYVFLFFLLSVCFCLGYVFFTLFLYFVFFWSRATFVVRTVICALSWGGGGVVVG